MTSLKYIITIILNLIVILTEVESKKRIQINIIGCYKRNEVIKSNTFDFRIYYPIYKVKRMKSCECQRKALCNFRLELPTQNRIWGRARVKADRRLKKRHGLNDFDLSPEQNDVIPIASEHYVTARTAPNLSINCPKDGKMFFNGQRKPLQIGKDHQPSPDEVPLVQQSGLYDCWVGSELISQNYITFIHKKPAPTRPEAIASRCGDSSLVCLNGGQCQKIGSKAICRCTEEFTGLNCSTRRLSFDLK